MRLLIVQYAGCYRDAFYRLSENHGETYYAQKYSVDAVADLKQYVDDVATLSYLTDQPYNELLPNGVRAIGAGMTDSIDYTKIIQLIEGYRPDLIVLRTPSIEVLKWIRKNNIPSIATLADSFQIAGLRSRIRNFQLARLLNHSCIHWIGNHGVGASRSLQNIGVRPDKIVPWDWPHTLSPVLFPAKERPNDATHCRLFFVGNISETKGVGDILRAVAELKSRGLNVTINLAGKGDIEQFQTQAQILGIQDQVNFLGLVNNKKIINLMRSADLVIIPSRHDYPEGFPMTIYEALCSRTPIVASDHPMFIEQLRHKQSALIFPSGQAIALAQCIEEVWRNPELYHALSVESEDTWQRLQIPVQWADLLNHWLQQTAEGKQWIREKSLASSLYS